VPNSEETPAKCRVQEAGFRIRDSGNGACTSEISNLPSRIAAKQRQHCLATTFVPDASAVLQGIELGEFCLAAALRGPVECWALFRVAASNAGVSWGDLRKNMVPPGA
jgi:hypothetical protein